MLRRVVVGLDVWAETYFDLSLLGGASSQAENVGTYRKVCSLEERRYFLYLFVRSTGYGGKRANMGGTLLKLIAYPS